MSAASVAIHLQTVWRTDLATVVNYIKVTVAADAVIAGQALAAPGRAWQTLIIGGQIASLLTLAALVRVDVD